MTTSSQSARLPQRRQRWPRAVRLCRHGQIRETIRRGRCFTRPWFRLYYWADGADSLRWAISVRRSVGSAVSRNRERRRIREVLRISRQQWPGRGWGVVIIDRPEPAGLTGIHRRELMAGLLTEIRP